MAISYGTGGMLLAPFAAGNAVPGGRSPVTGVREDMARRVLAMTQAMPPEVRARFQIISGFRDAGRQAEVNPRVTHSRHTGTGEPGSGIALDLGNDPVVLDWIGQHPEHGLGFPLRYMGPKEYNHMEMIDRTGGRVPIGGAPSADLGGASDFGGGSAAVPAYAETGDPQFKSGLAVPQAPPPPEEQPDPARQAALAALALQQIPGPPGSTGGFGGPGSLGDAFAQAVKAGQPAVQPPSTILGAQQYPNVGGPIPLSRRIG
jgi:hypothetical protein